MEKPWENHRTTHGKMVYRLVNIYITTERPTILTGKTYYFDWAIFNSKLFDYQRIDICFFKCLGGVCGYMAC